MKNATRVLASTIGAFMALGGIEHGIGEILQGPVAPHGLMILSWPRSEFFRSLGGEPAMTVIPHMLVTGFLAILVSAAMFVWSTPFIDRRHGGLIMILLSIAALLVGGGIFPPVFGMLMGIVATRIHSPLTWWRTRLSPAIRGSLARMWPWSFAVCISAWLGVLPGVPLLAYCFGFENLVLELALMAVALASLFLTVLCGFAYDAQTKSEAPLALLGTGRIAGENAARRSTLV